MGHLHCGVILLLPPESFRLLFPLQIWGFVLKTSLGFPNLNMKERKKMNYGLSNKTCHRPLGLSRSGLKAALSALPSVR